MLRRDFDEFLATRPDTARLSDTEKDELFNELFAALPSNRDRALVAFWISTGVRASELLGTRLCDMDPGQQLITVVRKGSRAVQQVPASADAFVWHPTGARLDLYACDAAAGP